MRRRHLHSNRRFFRAAALVAGSAALAWGPGCSDSDAVIIRGASPLQDSGGTRSPSSAAASGAGGASPSVERDAPSNAPGASTPSPAEGTGGAPRLDATPPTPGGGAGAEAPPASTPPSESSEQVAPPSEPAPVDPAPSEPDPTDPVPSAPAAPNCEPAEGKRPGLRLTALANGLDQPTYVAVAPGDDSRLFVLERSGAIRIVRDGQLLAEPFLDLRARVATSNEEGLIGLAFHPRYRENGRFFVQYAVLDASRPETAERQVQLSEFVRSGEDLDRADAESERPLMLVEQPADIHLGGMLAFNPVDGMLYVSRGDGGSNAQDVESPLGKMLRIDVDGASDERPYGIPDGNMGGDGVLPEIWSLGLRNPWRFSFDACNADLYIGDVGESTFEEIEFEPANTPGRNYGWKTLEGPQCFDTTATCDATGLTLPTVTYEHDFGCAVIGGYVYRGQRMPALRGTYLYADYCVGNFGSFQVVDGQAIDLQDITADINPDRVTLITSFGVDNAGELYVLSQLGGLYRIDPE